MLYACIYVSYSVENIWQKCFLQDLEEIDIKD